MMGMLMIEASEIEFMGAVLKTATLRSVSFRLEKEKPVVRSPKSGAGTHSYERRR